MPDQPQDPFEPFRRLWGPLGMPVPGMAMPTLDPKEVEKRIADLRSVEGWLTMNLSMVKLAIHGMEVQKTALMAMQPAPSGEAPPADAGATMVAQAMLWPWAAMMQMPAVAAEPPPADGAAKPE